MRECVLHRVNDPITLVTPHRQTRASSTTCRESASRDENDRQSTRGTRETRGGRGSQARSSSSSGGETRGGPTGARYTQHGNSDKEYIHRCAHSYGGQIQSGVRASQEVRCHRICLFNHEKI